MYSDHRDLHVRTHAFPTRRASDLAPITLAEYKYLSRAAATEVDAASEISMSEWFRCLAQIRPQASTRELLSTIYAVLMEISYVALNIDDFPLDYDVRESLERIALARSEEHTSELQSLIRISYSFFFFL